MESRSSPYFVTSYTKATIVLAFCWIVVSFTFLIYFGVTYVGPYNRIKDWRPTDCYISRTIYTSMEPCSCGVRCKGQFPCLKIIADCTGLDLHPGFSREQIYYTERDLDSTKCSYYPRQCSSDEGKNNMTVYFIKQEYSRILRTVHICNFNPRNQTQIIIHKGAKLHDVAYTLTMTTLTLLFGFMLLFIMLYCRSKELRRQSCCGCVVYRMSVCHESPSID